MVCIARISHRHSRRLPWHFKVCLSYKGCRSFSCEVVQLWWNRRISMVRCRTISLPGYALSYATLRSRVCETKRKSIIRNRDIHRKYCRFHWAITALITSNSFPCVTKNVTYLTSKKKPIEAFKRMGTFAEVLNTNSSWSFVEFFEESLKSEKFIIRWK